MHRLTRWCMAARVGAAWPSLAVMLTYCWPWLQNLLAQVTAERAQDKALAEQLLAKQESGFLSVKKESDVLMLDVLNREDKV